MRQLLHQSDFLGKELTVSSVLICIISSNTHAHTYTHTQVVLSTGTQSENIVTVQTPVPRTQADEDHCPLVNRLPLALMFTPSTNISSNGQTQVTRDYAKFFICVNSFDPYNNPVKKILFAPYIQREIEFQISKSIFP